MAKELYVTLERITQLYALLHETLEAEGHAMETLNLLALGEITQTKESLLSEAWNLEQSREAGAAALAVSLGMPSDQRHTLVELSDQMQGEEREKFRACHAALSELLVRCREQNQANMLLAESSLVRIDAMKNNILGKNGKNAENYNAQGNRNPVTEHGGRILSKQA